MESLNKVQLIGNLGKDPQYIEGDDWKKATFPLATTEKFKGKEKTEWHNIICWDKKAELANDHLHKGDRVYIEGKITTRQYDDQEKGKVYVTEVVCFNIIFLSKKSQDNRPSQDTGNRPPDDFDRGGDDEFQDDLPF